MNDIVDVRAIDSEKAQGLKTVGWISYLLHLVVEIKGYRGEDAVEKKSTMDTYWVPGVNHLGTYGRWAFAEFTEVFQIESDFKAKVDEQFNKLIETAASKAAAGNK